MRHHVSRVVSAATDEADKGVAPLDHVVEPRVEALAVVSGDLGHGHTRVRRVSRPTTVRAQHRVTVLSREAAKPLKPSQYDTSQPRERPACRA